MAAQFDITGTELDASPAVLVGTVDDDLRQVGGVATRVRLPHIQLDAGFHPKNLDVDRADRHHARRDMT